MTSDDHKRENQITKQTLLPEIHSLKAPANVNADKAVGNTSGHVVSQENASVTSIPSLSSSCSHTDADMFVSCECASSNTENSITFQQCTTTASFASIPVSVQVPFTFTAASPSHLCPVSLESSLVSLPASTKISTAVHNSKFVSPLAAPTTDLKISVTKKEFDPSSILCSSSSWTTQASSAFNTTAVIQSTTVPNSISLPIFTSVAKGSLSELTPSHSDNVTKMPPAIPGTITTTSSGCSATQISCAVPIVANPSSIVKTTPPKKTSSRKMKTTSSVVTTVKSG